MSTGDPARDNNLKAIQVSGFGRSVVISDFELILPGLAAAGTGGHITIDPPATDIAPSSEVTISGGTLVDALGAGLPRISDPPSPGTISSKKTALVNSMWRLRLPRLTTTEIGALSDKAPGDMVYDATLNKAQVWDGAMWKDLW